VEKKGVVEMKSKTAEPLYRQTIPIEDRGKTYISRYFKVDPLMSNHLGQPLHPLYYECNLRIDFAPDGGIYKVEWINKKLDPK